MKGPNRRDSALRNAWRREWSDGQCEVDTQPLKTRGRVTFRARPGLAWGQAYETDPKPHEDDALCQKNQVGAGILPMGLP